MHKKPINRSKFRLFFGRIYYFIKKHIYRHLSKNKFASKIQEKILPYHIYSDKSLLLKKLHGIDMQLQYNKIKNLKIAIKNINHIVMKPGEIFSYRKLIGNPNKKKGYKKGIILKDGKYKPGTGGGLCQLSNMIYRITLHTPLTVIERRRHSFDVFPDIQRKRPFGSGATCSFPGLDLQIKNNTDNLFQFVFKITETHLECGVYSDKKLDIEYKIVEKNHIIESQRWGGYIRSNELYRNIYKNKNKIKEEFITKNHARMMYNPTLHYQKT